MKRFLTTITSWRPSVEGRLLAAAALLAGLSLPAAAQTVTQNTPFPLGVHVSNPNGNEEDKEKQFENSLDKFRQVMKGAHVTHFNTFIDFTHNPLDSVLEGDNKYASWRGNTGWAAWSSNKSGPNYFGSSTGVIPVVGVPMNIAGHWYQADDFYKDIIAGKYDQVWGGIVKVWADQGYKTVILRNGYELNGTFMVWSPYYTRNPEVLANFVRAFQRMADIEHKAGKQLGVTVKVSWNPNVANDGKGNPIELYPGDSYVDIIGVDQYSVAWPLDLTNWAKGSQYEQLSREAWVADTANRRHYWTWPYDKYYQSVTTGKLPDLGDWCWSVRMTTDFALSRGKPIALEETGAGPKKLCP